MALQKQQIPISFTGGVDTKTDPKQVLGPERIPGGGDSIVPTKLLELENGVFTKKGEIRKRFGYDILRKTILDDGTELSTALGISTFKDELVLFNGVKLYTFIEASEAWKEKGTSTSVTISNRAVVRNIYQQTDPDYAYNNGIGCYVWKDSSAGVRYSVIDEVSGASIVENAILSTTGISPRAVGIGQYIFIYYIQGSAIKFQAIQISTPQLISVAIDLTTAVNATNKIYDVQKIGQRVYIAYNTNNGANSIALLYQIPNKVISSEVEFVAQQATKGISICSDSSDNIWLSWANAVGCKYTIEDYNLSSNILAPTVIENIVNLRNIASVSTSDTAVTFLYEVTSSPDNFIKKAIGTFAGTVSAPTVFVRSLGLASKFFTYNDENFITLTHSSTLQSTYFVYSLQQDIITKINENSGGGYTSSNILPTVVEQSTGKFIVPTLKKGQLLAENGVLFTSLGVASSTIDYISLNNFVTAELGNNLHIVGGVLQSYDGSTINETGFNVFPEGTVATEINPGTGNIANGFYQYAIVYAWTDNQGQIHRSAPSIPNEITLAAGPSNVQLVIPTLRISKKLNVFIEVYRTEKDGDIFYKVTSNTSLTLNNSSVDTITYVDTKTDAQLVSGELLYTTGGVLENIAPPSSSVVVNWKNRLVVKSADDENLLWYSKIRQEGSPVEFNDSLTLSVDPLGGDISALGVLDDKLVIFKETQIHIQAGDGPNNLGQQSDFGLPQLVASDVGCIDVNSVVQTPIGLIFKSKKGIELLDRSLQTFYIGAAVEAYNDSRITSAKLVADVNQIRFTTEDNLCLVYDYFFGQWSTFTNHEGVGATSYSDKFTFVKSNGDVYQENTSIYTDGAQSIKLKLVSSWIQLGNLEGFQRTYKLLLLGEYKSAHRLNIKLGFDFNDNFTQETEIDAESVMALTTYGEDSPYGAGSPYGGKFPLYQWRIFPKRQKCQAMRISIEDIMDSAFGESFSISAMRFEIGIKQGSNKLESGRSYGTS